MPDFLTFVVLVTGGYFSYAVVVLIGLGFLVTQGLAFPNWGLKGGKNDPDFLDSSGELVTDNLVGIFGNKAAIRSSMDFVVVDRAVVVVTVVVVVVVVVGVVVVSVVCWVVVTMIVATVDSSVVRNVWKRCEGFRNRN